MSTSIHSHYKGWDIEVRCVKERRRFLRVRGLPKFSAAGVAKLQDGLDLRQWVDCRPQTITTGDRIFRNGSACCDELMLEIKTLIDALQR